MFGNTIQQVKEIKKYTDDRIRIPFAYIIFLVAVFIFLNPKYITLIGASNWVPSNIREIALTFASSLYSQIIIILLILGSIWLALTMLSRVSVFRKILPKDVDYTNNTTVSWNEYSAIAKISHAIKQLVTTWWIYCFSLNVLFGRYCYTNFFDTNNGLNNLGDILNSNLKIMNCLFYLNILCAVYYILKALFEIRKPTRKVYLKYDDLSFYHFINSFEKANSLKEVYKTIILKEKYSDKQKYLLIHVQLSRYGLVKDKFTDELISQIEPIPEYQRTYEIMDSSENLSDIVYNFESLKDKA
ncbi:hypothetical protein [Caproiciproducens galactitolivorans]|uniref:Uncharacterized protein n=1 Tax=Caproiciproducens galactitolivorans TaxID=642589 RepID=A0ABT4BUS6_9FIRM|nr:hypothetical protein [Caproiciproducens galactitolivorans]MCY1714629.1 hypothetical protein [Caproiciproducens galactitolivorans]